MVTSPDREHCLNPRCKREVPPSTASCPFCCWTTPFALRCNELGKEEAEPTPPLQLTKEWIVDAVAHDIMELASRGIGPNEADIKRLRRETAMWRKQLLELIVSGGGEWVKAIEQIDSKTKYLSYVGSLEGRGWADCGRLDAEALLVAGFPAAALLDDIDSIVAAIQADPPGYMYPESEAAYRSGLHTALWNALVCPWCGEKGTLNVLGTAGHIYCAACNCDNGISSHLLEGATGWWRAISPASSASLLTVAWLVELSTSGMRRDGAML